MTGIELVYLIAALFGVGVVVIALRRAASKQIGEPTRSKALDVPAQKAGTAGHSGDQAEQDRDDEQDDDRADEDHPKSDQPPGDDQRDDSAVGADPSADVAALRQGLAKTRGGFVARLGKVFARKTIDESILDELEEILLTADIGPRTAERLFTGIKDKLSRSELESPEAIWAELRRLSEEVLAVDVGPVQIDSQSPFVLLTIGVNGVGKTTTIGKLAALHAKQGRKVMLAAGDTFRAAAVEQLEVWGDRAGVPVVRGKNNADPSSVIFDAISQAKEQGCDLLIADTAGRLHTKVDLMEELKKVRRVCDKAQAGAPHETWLVLDATTGQNAIAQAKMFKEMMDITGIVLTKLDGTAKGGVILGICDELGVPVRYIGIGEQVADLRPFDPHAFIEALYATDGQGALT